MIACAIYLAANLLITLLRLYMALLLTVWDAFAASSLVRGLLVQRIAH